jgi:cytochrome c553
MTDIPAADDKRWRLRSVLAVGAAILVGAALGIVVVPVVQGLGGGIDPFTAICRAIGVVPGSPARPTPPSQAAAQPVTLVAWTDKTIGEIYHANVARGAVLAQQRCVSCHTLAGNTPSPTIPRNVGQSRFALYKQLHDFKSGARKNAIMSPIAASLDDQTIADLAAYYGQLYRGAIDAQRRPFYVGEEIENLVFNGDVARTLPPCVACHGGRVGGPIETPTLTGQYAQYLEAQLHAFASGQRHNDIYRRMRNVAAKLTADEMQLLAIYYSGR